MNRNLSFKLETTCRETRESTEPKMTCTIRGKEDTGRARSRWEDNYRTSERFSS